jgi:hypothetical protein
MTKSEAIELFGGKSSYLARSMGITRQAVYLWPEELKTWQQDRIVGAAVREGKLLVTAPPCRILATLQPQGAQVP